MDKLIPICLAEFLAIKGLALMAFALVVYLYWIRFQEMRNERRERQWLATRRRELKEKAANNPVAPRGR